MTKTTPPKYLCLMMGCTEKMEAKYVYCNKHALELDKKIKEIRARSGNQTNAIS